MSLSPHPFKHYTGPVGSKSTGVYLDALLSYEIGSYEISRLTRIHKNDEYLESINLGSRNSAAKVKMREITKKRVGGGRRVKFPPRESLRLLFPGNSKDQERFILRRRRKLNEFCQNVWREGVWAEGVEVFFGVDSGNNCFRRRTF